jgi:predicted GTPase
MSNKVREEKLDFWVKNKLNVLFIGKHGVGKTAMVQSAFERNDPELDVFLGVHNGPVGRFHRRAEGKSGQVGRIIRGHQATKLFQPGTRRQ